MVIITISSVLKITITIILLLLLLKLTRLKANMMNVLKNDDPIWIVVFLHYLWMYVDLCNHL
jgi:hypothetical protein